VTDLPDTHRSALGWLAARGGEGVIDRHGRIVAQGEFYRSVESASVWLRLVTTGHVEAAGRGRLRLTPDGCVIGNRQPRHRDRSSVPHGRRMVDDNPDDFA
jgi:hypothetical protein